MVMAHKHLHELLQEDQEPFHLHNFIADRRRRPCQLLLTNNVTTKKQPIVQSSTPTHILCRQACFFSFHHRSPDAGNSSPFVDFSSPAKSPTKTPNAVFLHIPARTAALLLEAAMRIQKQSSSSSKPKPKTRNKNAGFGLFGSVLKRLGNRTKKPEIGAGELSVGGRKSTGKSSKGKENLEVPDRCCNGSRRNSMIWSESNEEKSLDLETSSSGCMSEEFVEIDFDHCDFERELCSSSPLLSPFRFALQSSPSTGRRTPEFLSPGRRSKEEEEKHEAESIRENQLKNEEEEEEKEQCSPVSVLDPPFEDDEEEGQEHVNDDGEEDDYDLECSYAILQRAKHQLLEKLQRFEKLADLDPIELEKRMSEEQDNEEDDEEEECKRSESPSLCEANAFLIREVLSESSPHISKVSADMRRLVSDLIAEERRGGSELLDTDQVVAERVCKRLDSWKEVEPNTIDMMVGLDFRREIHLWNNNNNNNNSDQEQLGEAAKEIELAIFGVLVEELSQELVCLTGFALAETLKSSMSI